MLQVRAELAQEAKSLSNKVINMLQVMFGLYLQNRKSDFEYNQYNLEKKKIL